MLEQLDIFNIKTEPIVNPLTEEPSNQVFSKWRMFEYLEGLEGKTALILRIKKIKQKRSVLQHWN